ncbi:hypothetical protein DVH05_015861 [Phytophthora capsici]|nr:hypothetical protein DVH05_015861 [Phytophthora capsici]
MTLPGPEKPDLEELAEGLVIPSETDRHAELSPNSQAIQSFMDDFESDSLNPVHLEDRTNCRDSYGVEEIEGATITSSFILSKPVVLSGSVKSSDDVTPSQSGQEIESLEGEMPADSEKRPPVRPRWMIAKTMNKSGHVKVSAATRMKAINSTLNQSARFMEAVASGLDPSVGVLLEAVQAGITYRQVEMLRSLAVLRNTNITVFDRLNKQETNAYKLRTVLPLRRIESCEAQRSRNSNDPELQFR